MGHESNYITVSLRGHLPDVRFSGTVKVPLPAVSRGYPMSFRRGVFVLSVNACKAPAKSSFRPRPVATERNQAMPTGMTG